VLVLVVAEKEVKGLVLVVLEVVVIVVLVVV
jgi:hypothetical protein